ncbi:MAG: ABC transporter ATP-binding protein [Chlamydiales bacterium]|nr:ABC transporter ATP-binding protein [Chlamydiales bacterium]
MKLLLKAALKSRKHLYLLVITFFSLVLLTVASQMEMFSLGTLMDRSVVTSSTPLRGNPIQFLIEKARSFFSFGDSGVELLLGVIAIVAVFKAVMLFISRFATQVLSIRISRDLRHHYFEYIQYLPMSFYQKYDIGTLASRVASDASQIAQSVNAWITNYLHTPFTLVTTLGACFYISWQLSMVVFLGIPLIVIPIVILARKVKKVTRQLQRNQEKFTSVLIDSLAGIQTVKIFGMEQFSLEKYKLQNEQMAHLETKTAKYDLLTRPILHTITTICLVLVVLSGLYVFKMNIAELFSFCGLLYLAYEPIKKFADTNTNIQKGVVAAERLFEVLNIKPDLIDDPKAISLKSFKESINFDNVSFRYGDDWVLRDVSFSVKKGETVALVGATGAGKSTIVQLLPRLYDVQKGKISIDGKPLQAYTQKSLREQIAFVSQKPFLFYDTIASNISFGRNFTREEIIDAAKRAHASEFIDQLPLGYDTPLAETGKNLSGGQQQRLAIARALVKKAPILILDEATSSLDAISELRIKEAIHELHGEVTQIIIAHRLSTIEHADRIIYFEHGRKLAEGTREELLATCKPFKLLWETHFRRLEPASL